jgi:anti-sigma factor RsiW
MSAERVTDADLQAYIDGQLDTTGRIGVEAWLQENPEAAAEAMEGLRLRDEVRLFLAADDWPAPPATIGLARQVTRQLGSRAWGLRVRRAVAAAVLIGAGWVAHAEFELFVDQVAAAHPVPAYADEAAEAYEAMRLKLTAGHAPDATLVALDAPRTGGQVPVPGLGEGLRFVGSDFVPWDGGTAVVAVYRSGHEGGDVVMLFAAEAPSFAVSPPEAARVHGSTTVFWQAGPFAYALNGTLAEAELLAIARAAAPRPWSSLTRHRSSTEGANHHG